MSFFEIFKARPRETAPTPENDETRLQNLEKRLADLKDWQNSWIADDRALADNLEKQILELRQKLGK